MEQKFRICDLAIIYGAFVPSCIRTIKIRLYNNAIMAEMKNSFVAFLLFVRVFLRLAALRVDQVSFAFRFM